MVKRSLLKWLAILLLLMVSIIYLSNNWIKINFAYIELDNLPESMDGFRIVLLSDLHDSEFGKNQKNLIEIVHQQSPDIIVFVGDLVEDQRSDIDGAMNLMNELSQIAPVYFVEGNHDLLRDVKDAECGLAEKLRQNGVTYLFNTWTTVERNGSSFNLVGIGDLFCGRARLEQATRGLPPGRATILLSHNPKILPEAPDRGIDLVLAGHNHGGQVRLPFCPALIAPPGEWLPRYDSGLYWERQCPMYLTRGLGYTTMIFDTGFRFFNRPEVAVIVLQHATAIE